jgi:hypothetical protein
MEVDGEEQDQLRLAAQIGQMLLQNNEELHRVRLILDIYKCDSHLRTCSTGRMRSGGLKSSTQSYATPGGR